ncbi:MAG: phosphate ABC transporter permease subunit PstC [Oligoflexia bacterium]|nr:phosphate ABC transporter permease subunit PstC [Oligoflexia bacterium]MBF0364939.1 phosphate ABC transporter permease subunit PstC [Oligoflexia bacterium]
MNKILFWNEEKIGISLIKIVVVLLILFICTMILLLVHMSLPAIKVFGLSFITNSEWNPVEEVFGAWPFIYGTLVTSFLALLLATPFGVFSALFISDICPLRFKGILSTLVDLIASIPSIVFGMWGLFFLAPFVRDHLAPLLREIPLSGPLFSGPCFGISILSASMILAIMILPTISSLTREIFNAVPTTYKEAALAIGATNFEKIKLSLLRPSLVGIIGALGLALARAIGETMAVVMLIGNTPQVVLSLLAPGATMASILANEYAEASSTLHLASLCYIAVILFAITMIVNFLARILIRVLSPKW